MLNMIIKKKKSRHTFPLVCLNILLEALIIPLLSNRRKWKYKQLGSLPLEIYYCPLLFLFYLLPPCLQFPFSLNPSHTPYPAYFNILTHYLCLFHSSYPLPLQLPWKSSWNAPALQQAEGFSRPFSPAGPCQPGLQR